MLKNFSKKILFICLSMIFINSISLMNLSAEKQREEIFFINPPYNPGMFSVFNSLLGILNEYDTNQHLYNGIDVRLESGFYFDKKKGPNWWEYFFEPISIYKSKKFKSKTFKPEEYSDYGWSTLYKIDRQRGFELINRYMKLKKHLQNKIDKFVLKNFHNHYVIGIHYRGTDKISESPRISYEEMEGVLNKTIKQLSKKSQKNLSLFIATDEQEFLDFIKERFTCPITYTNAIRSSNGMPTHVNHYKNNNYQKGEDALMDCILLSRTNYLIRTTSNLSFISERFNPNIPVIIVN